MHGFKVAKDWVTVLLIGGNISGDMKHKPLTVYHSQRPRVFKNIDLSRLHVIWKSNTKAWVTCELFADWFNNHFIPHVKEYCVKKGILFKVLLLLYDVPVHQLDYLYPDVKVIYQPPRTTALLQIMDQVVIATFKA